MEFREAEYLGDVEDKGQLELLQKKGGWKILTLTDKLEISKPKEEMLSKSEDLLSKYDDLSDSQSEAEHCKECDGQGEVVNHIHNKELNFLFAPGRNRSGRVVKTSARAIIWMESY